MSEQNQRVKLTTAAPFTPTFVEHNVTRSSDPAQLYASRVRGRQILLDNPARESRTRKDRERKKAARAVHRARSDAGVIGKNQVREKGLWKLAPSETRCALPCQSKRLPELMSRIRPHARLPQVRRVPGDTPLMDGLHGRAARPLSTALLEATCRRAPGTQCFRNACEANQS